MENTGGGAAEGGQMKIQIDVSDVEGTYSNLALLAHSSSEFIIDFARLEPGRPKAKVYSRIIMTPQNVKSLLMALQSKVANYEASYGTIPTGPGGDPSGGIGFKLP